MAGITTDNIINKNLRIVGGKSLYDAPKAISLTLPFPPSLNTIYATYRGRRILSARGREYKADVLALCFANRVKPIAGDIAIEIKAYRPRKIGDLDNLQKIIFDSLKGSAFFDDKQIVRIVAERFDDKSNPRVEIEISKVLESEFRR